MYLSLLNVFSTPAELQKILAEPSSMINNTKIGQDFFTKQYGLVDGNEVMKIAQSRQWFRGIITIIFIVLLIKFYSFSELPSPKTEIPTVENLIELLEEEVSSPGPLDYLARGESIPEELVEYHFI